MINISKIKDALSSEVLNYYKTDSNTAIVIEDTKKDFEGDLTIVVFSLLKYSKKSPEDSAKILGDHLLNELDFFEKFNVVKGFLNLSIKKSYWLGFFNSWCGEDNYGFVKESSGQLYMVEYSSPNTNKPLHLGH
jgi:arginyl-tRNA synthetase